MGLKGQFARWVSVLGLAGLVACSGLTSADIATDIMGEATPMNLESTAFAAGSEIPSRYTCDGDNRSPALAWEAPPEGTGSLALVVEDPDAPSPEPARGPEPPGPERPAESDDDEPRAHAARS